MGNTGWEGGYVLDVLDAPTMSGRIGWNVLNDNVTYQLQIATDASFSASVFDLDRIDQNWIEPTLPADFYYFRVRATDLAGNSGPWSETGTLEILEDLDAPIATITSPSTGQTFTKGQPIRIELAISDDTVLRLALFSINGIYTGTLGLGASDWKLLPSLGVTRTYVYETDIPKKGNASSLEIVVIVSDVVGHETTVSTVVGSGDTKGGGGKGKGHNK